MRPTLTYPNLTTLAAPNVRCNGTAPQQTTNSLNREPASRKTHAPTSHTTQAKLHRPMPQTTTPHNPHPPCPRSARSRPPHRDPRHRTPRRHHPNHKQATKGHSHTLLTLLHYTPPRDGKQDLSAQSRTLISKHMTSYLTCRDQTIGS